MTCFEIVPLVEGMDIVLPQITSQFDLGQTLDCGQAFRWSPIDRNDGGYCGIAMGRYLEISRKGEDIILHHTTMEEYNHIWKKYFDLDTDYNTLKEQFATNKIMAEAISYAPGIRVLCQDPWEMICTFIFSANNNIPRIKGIVERLCELAGEEIAPNMYGFPTPNSMAKLSVDDLAVLRCGYRNKYIIDATSKVVSNQVDLTYVATMPTTEAKEALMQISGIGPKVADCVLLFGFGRHECFPMDTWMKKVMCVLFPKGLPKKLIANAGIAQQYLFHYARNHPQLF